MKQTLTIIALLAFVVASASAKKSKFDYSQIFVPEEGGIHFDKITDDNDNVADYDGKIVQKWNNTFGIGRNTVKRTSHLDWWVIPQIAISPDGKKIAYINEKNNVTNIMVKDARRGSASTQRTFRSNVEGVSWSDNTICFTELRNGHHGVYLVNADQGSVVRQISTSTDNDLGGVLSNDGNTVYFHRGEGYSSYGLWSYNMRTNLFSNYSHGMTVCPVPGNKGVMYCARFTSQKESEIWRLNYETGVEEVIVAQNDRSFTTPQLSPDGKWILITGDSRNEKTKEANTDIFVVRSDGSQFTQLTYHQGNDLSPIWSRDGKSIFFLSQRGSAAGNYNVWRMDFNM